MRWHGQWIIRLYRLFSRHLIQSSSIRTPCISWSDTDGRTVPMCYRPVSIFKSLGVQFFRCHRLRCMLRVRGLMLRCKIHLFSCIIFLRFSWRSVSNRGIRHSRLLSSRRFLSRKRIRWCKSILMLARCTRSLCSCRSWVMCRCRRSLVVSMPSCSSFPLSLKTRNNQDGQNFDRSIRTGAITITFISLTL